MEANKENDRVIIKGSLKKMSLIKWLEKFNNPKESCVIRLKRNDKVGIVWIKDKQIYDAQIGNEDLPSQEAIYKLMSWKDGYFDIDVDGNIPPQPKIHFTIDNALMEYAQLVDEKKIKDVPEETQKSIRKYIPKKKSKKRLVLSLLFASGLIVSSIYFSPKYIPELKARYQYYKSQRESRLEAIADLRSALELKPGWNIAESRLADHYKILGEEFAKKGDTSKAIKVYEDLLKLNLDINTKVSVNCDLGKLYKGIKNFKKAKQYYESALKLDKDYVVAKVGLDDIIKIEARRHYFSCKDYLRKNKISQAIDECKTYLSLEPEGEYAKKVNDILKKYTKRSKGHKR